MAVNLTNADSVLKSTYLDAVSEQLNFNTNPFLAVIEQTSNDVWGKDVKKAIIKGINNGVSAGDEDGNLPAADKTNYYQMTATLKNLYGVIEISDKAIRASENNAGAMVNLLNSEMENLIKASKYHFGRMLFGEGNGKLVDIDMADDENVYVSNTENVEKGMIVDIVGESGNVIVSGIEIKNVDSEGGVILNYSGSLQGMGVGQGCYLSKHGMVGKELTGLGAIFGNQQYLYGIDTIANPWIKPYKKTGVGAIDEIDIQTAIDEIEKRSGGEVDFIICSWGVRRALQKAFSANKIALPTMELAGGFKAMSYNGIPIVVDRFCPQGTMYLLNSKDFALHQLCDWQWLSDDDGRVLKQIPGKPVYTATLVKYAELMCSRPNGQGMLTGIAEA
ncbi:MAG: phage major capsid protein [Clostridiales bacterium]|nr:phage major capsid protein [Clostridiales bacterium]